MKNIAIMLVLGIIMTSAFCMLAPNASAAHVKETYTDAQLPDIYYINVFIDINTYVYVNVDSVRYSYFYRYYNDADNALFEADLKNKVAIPRSNSTSNTDGSYHIYVFTYEDPTKYTVSVSSYNKRLAASDLWEGSKAIDDFYFYSGQKVKVDLEPGTDLFMGSENDYLQQPNLKAGKVNEIVLTAQGEYKIYGKSSYYDYDNGDWAYTDDVIFVSFIMEYDEPPSAGAFGAVFLIVAVVCMGSMIYFARPQKIK
jgi:hypothetical protein